MRLVLQFGCALAAFVLVLAPVGFAILRLNGRRVELADLGMALALGYSVVPALLLAELHLGGAWLVLPVAAGAALWIGRDWKGVLTGRSFLSVLPVPLLVAAFALWVNASDVEVRGAELSFRRGWDVFDRTFYAAVTAAAHRAPPPGTENPLFAGVSAPGSYYPAFLALFLQRYAGLHLVPAVLVHVPALGLFLLALVTERLLAEALAASRLARLLTLVLLLLGGDFAWLVAADNATALERTRHFFVFHSWSAQALFVNAWSFGAPLAFACLISLRRFLSAPTAAAGLMTGLLAGALFETRIFALAPLVAGFAAIGLLPRHRRAFAAAAAMALGCLPWLALTLLFPERGGSPFLFFPLAVVRKLLVSAPALGGLAAQAQAGGLAWGAALAAGSLLLVLGGLGVRLLGVARLAGECRGRSGTFHLGLATSVVAAMLAGLLLIGNPLPADGSQFLAWAQFALWLYAGPAIADLLPRRRALAAAGLCTALFTPVYYVAAKTFPDRLTSSGADRARDFVRNDALNACLWLDAHSSPGDRLIIPLFTPADESGGTRAIRISLLSNRALLAAESPFAVDAAEHAQRVRDVRAFYEAQDAAAGVELLDRWHVGWVWEDAAVPIRFQSQRLQLRFAQGSVRLYEVRPH